MGAGDSACAVVCAARVGVGTQPSRSPSGDACLLAVTGIGAPMRRFPDRFRTTKGRRPGSATTGPSASDRGMSSFYVFWPVEGRVVREPFLNAARLQRTYQLRDVLSGLPA
jgi:hypothetical protein